MQTNEIEGNEKTWVSSSDGFDVYRMQCPLDCGCIAICMMCWHPGVPATAECANCGDVTYSAWPEEASE